MKKIDLIPRIFLAAIMLLFAVSTLPSCTKTNTKTVTIHDTIQVAAPVSKMSLLTGKEWELDSVFTNYTGPGTGTVVYVRGGAGNTENLDNFFNTFTSNGDYWALENTTYYSGKWSFTDSDSTIIKIVTGVNTQIAKITLGLNKLEYFDSTDQILDVNIIAPQ